MVAITKGKIVKTKSGQVSGLALLSYGTDGIGKTTMATAHKIEKGEAKPSKLTEGCFVGDVERGSHALDVARIEMWDMDYPQIGQALKEIKDDNQIMQSMKTFVLDSVDWLVVKIEKYLCQKHQKNNISDFAYGSGQNYVVAELMRLIAVFDDFRERGINVHLLAHAKTTQVEDPISPVVYTKYDLALHHKSASKLKEWADVVGFAYHKPAMFVEEDLGFGKTRRVAQGQSRRVISTQETPQWEAKSRYQLPAEMPLDGYGFMETLRQARGL